MRFEEYIRNVRPRLDADQPNEDLIWIGIAQSLENHAKQKRIYYWKYALSAAAMIVFAAVAGFYVAKNDTRQIERDTELFATSPKIENNETVSKDDYPTNHFSAGQETTTITQIVVVEPLNDKKLTVEKNSDNNYIVQSEAQEKIDESEDYQMIQLITDVMIQSLNDSVSMLPHYSVASLFDIEEDETDTKKTEKWQLAAVFGTVGAGGFTDTNNEYTYDDDVYSLRKSAIAGENSQSGQQSLYYMTKDDFTNMQHRQPVSFGIKACKRLGQYVGVESGLIYTYLASRIEWSGYNTNQNLHYMGIPVNLAVYMGNAKSNWRFYISGGGMVEKGLRNISRQERRLGSETRITTTRTPIDGLQWSLNGGFGVNYRLEKRWGIYFEPRMGYSFDCGQPVSIRTENPLSFGINLGLNYVF